MSRKILPEAEKRGARIITGCRTHLLARKGRRIIGIIATRRNEDGSEQLFRLDAGHVFVCCGPTETPALLLRSGIRYRVGNTLRIHPYLKVAACFKEEVNAESTVLPLIQVKEFWPDISMGGAFFTLGHLAMTLSENWPENHVRMDDAPRMAQYYVGVRGTGKGSVRPTLLGPEGTVIRYELSPADRRNLSIGLARLSTLLLAGGAESVHPSVYGIPSIRSEAESVRWLDEELPKSRLSLVTVHAFCSCPMGNRQDRCAADSFGKVYGYDNLYISDASMLPDSPGVNPQGAIMALARRNAQHFASTHARG